MLSKFWSFFTNFGTKKFFLENPTLSRTTSNEFLAPCQNLEKTYKYDSKKTPRQTEG